MHEIEIKFKVASLVPIISQLPALGFNLEWQGNEHNWFFDYPDQRLEKAGQVLRLKTKPNHTTTLTFKGKRTDRADAIKDQEEIETTVTDPKATMAILLTLGFEEVLTYQKQRQHWKNNAVVIELDTLNGQHYVEIEADEANMAKISQELGLDPSQTIKESYLDMVKGKDR